MRMCSSIVRGVLVLTLCGFLEARAEIADAPINSGVSFLFDKAIEDDLFVESGQELIQANGALLVHGAPISRIVATGAIGGGRVHAAHVFTRAGDSLYLCHGRKHAVRIFAELQVFGDPENTPWRALYNRGPARIMIEINRPGGRDDGLQEDGVPGTCTVWLVGGDPGKVYNVNVAEQAPGQKLLVPGGGKFGNDVPLNLNFPLNGPFQAIELKIKV